MATVQVRDLAEELKKTLPAETDGAWANRLKDDVGAAMFAVMHPVNQRSIEAMGAEYKRDYLRRQAMHALRGETADISVSDDVRAAGVDAWRRFNLEPVASKSEPAM